MNLNLFVYPMCQEISRTRIDWNADLHPHWDHTCRGQPFKLGSEDEVEFQAGSRKQRWADGRC